jgi:hypothetical protein
MAYPFLKIFLAGRHRTAHPKKQWDDSDIDKILASTLAKSEEKIPFTAQLPNGKHPKGNLPVYGLANKNTLRKTTVNGVAALEIQPCDFAEGLLDALKDEGLDKMSVRLNGSDFSLEHICFVANPAVQGIPAISDYDFSASDGGNWIDLSSGASAADFADSRMSIVGRALRSLRDWIIGEKGLDVANTVLPDYGLDELKEWQPELPDWAREQINDVLMRVRALEERTGIQQPKIISDYNFNEEAMKELEELKAAQAKQSADFAAFRESAAKNEAAMKAENEALRKANEALLKTVSEMREASINRDNADFIDALVREGKILPAERDLQLLELNMAAKTEGKINFSGVEKDMLTAKREILAARPVIAPLGKPIATKSVASGGRADFSMDTYEEQVRLRKAAEKLAREQNIDFSAALNILLDDQKYGE